MFFKQIPVGPMQNFSYLIGDESTKEAIALDAGWETKKIIEIAEKEKLKIKKIILTHSHFDHVQQINELATETKAEVYFHEIEKDEIKRHIKDSEIKTTTLKDNDEIKLGKLKIRIIHTPGHTPGAICLHFENKLITGDTLFVGAIGRVDLPGGNPIHLFESLEKLKKLDDKTEIYPGHDYGQTKSSTIGSEKKNNPYFICKTKQEFLSLVGF